MTTPTLFPTNEHPTHRVHNNSRQALRDERPKLTARARMILRDVAQHGEATDREIRNDLGFDDMNAVRPRVTELIAAGLLYESNRVQCGVSGKRVRVVDATRRGREAAQ